MPTKEIYSIISHINIHEKNECNKDQTEMFPFTEKATGESDHYLF